jgi:hypothetical protein
VAPAAADEHDELTAAEQRARVSGSNDSPTAMRWSTQALPLLGAPSSRLSVAKAFDEMPCRLVGHDVRPSESSAAWTFI